MSVRHPQRLLPALLLASLSGVLAAQEAKSTAYPQRDILSPFRDPSDVYAPPDKLFLLLRRMRAIAEDPSSKKDFDKEGREVVDNEGWRAAREEVDNIGLDAGYLAAIMRLSKNADDRRTAFYAGFFCKQPDYVVNLISHIPGEPVRKTREESFPRAIAYLAAHLKQRFGDLSEDEKKLAILALPQPGSPAAKAAGITRLPRDSDHLLDLRLIPFFQLLDLDEPVDQAQGLWFLKEVFQIRGDLAVIWLEPVLPRIRQLLGSEDRAVREQAIGLLKAIGPEKLPEAKADDEPRALQAWADLAIRGMFPPIRNLNDAIVQMLPSPERDAILQAGLKALEGASLGEATFGKTKDGNTYRGFRVLHVPDELKALAIPEGATITAVNGVPVSDSANLLSTLQQQFKLLKHPRSLLVEYVHDEAPHACEFRIL
jgi:hypothetical protein